MVTAAKARIAPSKSVSVKIRIHKDIKFVSNLYPSTASSAPQTNLHDPSETIRWVQIVQRAGVDYITVHGRLRSQRSSTPPNYDAIRALRPHITIPMLANGDAYTYTDVLKIASLTGADGVMAARGLLENPALFAQHTEVPAMCVKDFLAWAVRCPIPFALVLHHLTEMTARMPGMTKRERRAMMQCADLLDLLDFVGARWP
jgi:tRNA-dihydrouridine synthase 4